MKKTIHVSSPTFDPAAWLARRYRISPAHARVIAELGGMGKRHTDRDASQIGSVVK